MTIQKAVQILVNVARASLSDEQSNHVTIEACEKLEEIFRLEGRATDETKRTTEQA